MDNTKSHLIKKKHIFFENLRAFMIDVDSDAAFAREFPKYTNIVSAHLLEEESDVEVLFVRQQFNDKDYLHAIKQYSLKLAMDYKVTKSMQSLYVGECWKALSCSN